MIVNCQCALDAIPTEGLDQEISLAVRLNRAGIERILGREASEDYEKLTGDFIRQWRRHSREGGLADSVALLAAKT